MSHFTLGQELDEINEKYDGKDDFLGIDILTNASHLDAVRGTMFASMITQSVCINNPEPPKIFTRYENQVGKYSSSYLKNDDEYKIIKKINKFSNIDNYYILIVKNMKTKEYDIIERKLGESLTENYCYLNNNEKIDSFQEKDKIPKDTLLYHSTNFDDFGNYSYGLNAKVCYMIENNTIEDAIVCSESLAKRMSFNYIYERAINLNTNDLFVNIYGDDKNYKCFPDINENTQGKVLLVKRRINYENALFDLKDEQLKNINYKSDTIVYSPGRVIDIDIYSNVPIEELKQDKYNEQIVYYLEEQKRYYTEIKETLEKLESKGAVFTDSLSFIYRKSIEYLNEDIKWRNDKTEFNNVYLKIKVLKENPIHIGSKIAGRYGNKGVISKILPDEQMPTNQFGERVDLILNALGVINRLNPAQLYEQELNFISDNIIRDMKKLRTVESKKKFLFDYIKEISEDEYESLNTFYNLLDKDEKKEFINEFIENGIYIHQPPFWNNLDFEGLSKLYNKYKYKPYEVTINGVKVEKPMLFGEEYMLRLKHEPSGKLSVRSTSFINLKNAPSKSLAYKKGEEIVSKTPIRMGNLAYII